MDLPSTGDVSGENVILVCPAFPRPERQFIAGEKVEPVAYIAIGAAPIGASVSRILPTAGSPVPRRVIHRMGPDPVCIQIKTVAVTLLEYDLERLKFRVACRFPVIDAGDVRQRPVVRTAWVDCARPRKRCVDSVVPGQPSPERAHIGCSQHRGLGELPLHSEVKLLDPRVTEVRVNRGNGRIRNCRSGIVRIGRRKVRAFRYSLADPICREEIARTGAEHEIERLLPELPDGGSIVALRIVKHAVSASDHSLSSELISNADPRPDGRKVGIY